MYLIWQTWANSVDRDETPQMQRLILGSTLFATQPAILDTPLGSKLYFFQISD